MSLATITRLNRQLVIRASVISLKPCYSLGTTSNYINSRHSALNVFKCYLFFLFLKTTTLVFPCRPFHNISKIVLKDCTQSMTYSGVFIVNFEQTSHIVLVFPLLTLNK